jgi:DNA polymerase-3 subunit epsilon
VSTSAYARALLPNLDAGWQTGRYCVLDLETTGLDPRRDQIVSYAAVPIDEGRIRVAGITQSLVRPTRQIPAAAIRIHGIRPADVEAAPTLRAALPRLLDAMTGRILVVHVDWVERGFLREPLEQLGLTLREPVLDTARLAQALLPELPREPIALTVLARRLSLPVYKQHDARGDALTTAQVFLALASGLDRRAPQTIRTLAAAGSADPRRAPLRAILRRRRRRSATRPPA